MPRYAASFSSTVNLVIILVDKGVGDSLPCDGVMNDLNIEIDLACVFHNGQCRHNYHFLPCAHVDIMA